MTQIKTGFLAVATAALLAGCASGFEATYDSDPAQDFSGYKTFSWVSEHPMKVGTTARIPNPMLEHRIMATVESALGTKGFRLIPDVESADFALSFTIGSREEIKVDSYPTMSGGYVGHGYPGLALDVFDVAEHRPVWHGVASKRISDSDRKDAGATVKAAVDAILAGFPPTTTP